MAKEVATIPADLRALKGLTIETMEKVKSLRTQVKRKETIRDGLGQRETDLTNEIEELKKQEFALLRPFIEPATK